MKHLLHEAWSSSANPVAQAGDSTAAEAGMVARAAGAEHLTLVHVNPLLADEEELLAGRAGALAGRPARARSRPPPARRGDGRGRSVTRPSGAPVVERRGTGVTVDSRA